MSNPDFTQEVLTYLTDGSGAQENWDTTNFSPAPTLVDGDEMRNDSAGTRARGVDILDENVITVDSAPTANNEPIGTEFDFRRRAPVRVICEAYHADGGGQIADKDAFNAMVGEARRAILTERKFPVGDYTYLTIGDESDDSAEQPMDANYFRTEFPVAFVGFESLP